MLLRRVIRDELVRIDTIDFHLKGVAKAVLAGNQIVIKQGKRTCRVIIFAPHFDDSLKLEYHFKVSLKELYHYQRRLWDALVVKGLEDGHLSEKEIHLGAK
jgi:hypothetical protein